MDSMLDRVATDAGFRVLSKPESFDPGQDAANWAALQALQNSSNPAWVYSATEDIILWANAKTMSLISESQAHQRVPAGRDAGECSTAPKAVLAAKVQQAGCSMEYSIPAATARSPRSRGDLGNGFRDLPGWPKDMNPPGMGSGRVTLQYVPIQCPEKMQVTPQRSIACLVQLHAHAQWHYGYPEEELRRIIEMHNSSRIFRFMFDSDGNLLQANNRALTYLQDVLNGDNLSAWTLFQLGIYKSSKDRMSQYKLAFDTVFEKGESYRCQHERVSRKNPGERKWVELEMWPIKDPITGEPAMLVSQMNMTRTKLAEVQLQEEKDELMEHAEALEAKLNDRPIAFTVKSPMQKLVEFFDGLMKGATVPDMKTLLKFRAMVVSSNLGEVNIQEILEGNAIQSDAGLSILQQLGYRLSGKSMSSAGLQRRSGGPRHSSIEGEDGLPDMSPSVDVTQSHRDFSDKMFGLSSLVSPSGPARIRSLNADESQMIHIPAPSSVPTHLPSRVEDLPTSKPQGNPISAKEFNNSPLTTKNVLPALERCLQKAQNWDFDIFELNQVSHGNPLSSIGFFLLKQSGLVSHLGLDEERLTRWLRAVEETYEDNQYHNRIHAADVTQKMFTMLMRGGIHQGLTKYQLLAAILAAIVHDAGHPGNTNDYLVATEHPLAIEYNDSSPLENYHACTCFKLMRNDDYNFLPDMELEVYRSIRTLIIDLVLATDMKRHFDTLSQFQCALTGATTTASSTNQTGELAAGVRRLWERISDDQMTEAQHALKLKVALKVADLGHLASPYPVHIQWVERLQEEFFCQGDNEQTFNLPVSPLMDRRKSGIMTAQIGFFDVVAMPLYRSLATAYSKCRPMAEGLERNYAVWKTQNGVAADDSPRSQQRFMKRHNTL